MASSTAVLPLPTKRQFALRFASALPSDLSKSPVLGIIGVVMGAGIVTLTGRMLTLGTADLKGSLGIGFDQGAWIGSAYNIASPALKYRKPAKLGTGPDFFFAGPAGIPYQMQASMIGVSTAEFQNIQ